MSKERLEEIKGRHTGDFGITDSDIDYLIEQNKRYREIIQESNVIFAEAIESIDLGEKDNGLEYGVKLTYEALESESDV